MNLKQYYKELLSEQLLNEISAGKLGRIKGAITRKQAQMKKISAALDAKSGVVDDAFLDRDAVRVATVGSQSPRQQNLNALIGAAERGEAGRITNLNRRAMKIAGQAGEALGQGAKNLELYGLRTSGIGRPGGLAIFKPKPR